MLWKSSCNSVFEQDKNNYVFKLIKGVHGPCPDDELAHPEGNYQFKERSEVKSPVLEIGKYVWSADIETIADELIHAKMFYIFQVHGGKNTVGLSFNKSSIPPSRFIVLDGNIIVGNFSTDLDFVNNFNLRCEIKIDKKLNIFCDYYMNDKFIGNTKDSNKGKPFLKFGAYRWNALCDVTQIYRNVEFKSL